MKLLTEREKMNGFGNISNLQINTTVKKNKILSSGSGNQRRTLPWCVLVPDRYLCSLNWDNPMFINKTTL